MVEAFTLKPNSEEFKHLLWNIDTSRTETVTIFQAALLNILLRQHIQSTVRNTKLKGQSV
jgi:hypothetical protein